MERVSVGFDLNRVIINGLRQVIVSAARDVNRLLWPPSFFFFSFAILSLPFMKVAFSTDFVLLVFATVVWYVGSGVSRVK